MATRRHCAVRPPAGRRGLIRPGAGAPRVFGGAAIAAVLCERGRLRRSAGPHGRGEPTREELPGRLPLRVLWVDDKPESVLHLVHELRRLGGDVRTATSTEAALSALTRHTTPDVIVSDTKRAGDVSAGFRAVADYRAAGYFGPVVFCTGQVSGRNHRYAEEAGAVGLTNSWSVLVELLEGIGHSGQQTVPEP